MPVLFTTNINHISNKLDELSILSRKCKPTVIALTETFLDNNTPDQAIAVQNYTVTRRDRNTGAGGGVLLFIADGVNFSRLSQFECEKFEVMFVIVRPPRLPRPLTVLIIAVVYCPPSYNAETKRELALFILKSVDSLMRQYPDCGVFITGDFNTLDTSYFNKHLRLNQLAILW